MTIRKWSWFTLALAAGCGTKNSASAAFHPTANASIPGGTHSYTSFTIPAGVTATVAADAILQVSGAVAISGNLVGDCVGIDLEGQGAITITGKLDNHCSAAGSKDLIIHTTNGARLSVGQAGAPAALATSGNFEISNDPALEPSDFTVLPSQRSATPLAPACAAAAQPLFTFAVADAPAAVSLFGSGAAPAGGGLAYAWDLGDGATATGAQTAHAFAPGSYDVVLTVTGDDGKTCAAKLKLVVADGAAAPGSGPPAISLHGSGLVAAAGDTVSFSSESFSPSGAAPTVAWDFGDGAQATGASITHAFAQSGRYVVTATATDAAAQTSTATAAVYVFPVAAKASSRRGALTASSCANPDSTPSCRAPRRSPPPPEPTEATSAWSQVATWSSEQRRASGPRTARSGRASAARARPTEKMAEPAAAWTSTSRAR